MSTVTKRARHTHTVLSGDVEARITDYLTVGDLCSLRATEKNARHRRFSAERNIVEVPMMTKTRVLQGFWQCYHLPAVTDIIAHRFSVNHSLIDDEDMRHIARHCPQLSSLDLGCESRWLPTALLSASQVIARSQMQV